MQTNFKSPPSPTPSPTPAPPPIIHHFDNNTNNLENISNSNRYNNTAHSNGNDITIANIVTNVFDIVENSGGAMQSSSMPPTSTPPNINRYNLTEIASNHAVPFIYIDDNGIFQIKFNQSEHILPSINKNCSIKSNEQLTGGQMTSINDKNIENNNENNLNDQEQYDLDIRRLDRDSVSSPDDENVIIERHSNKDESKKIIIIVDEEMTKEKR